MGAVHICSLKCKMKILLFLLQEVSGGKFPTFPTNARKISESLLAAEMDHSHIPQKLQWLAAGLPGRDPLHLIPISQKPTCHLKPFPNSPRFDTSVLKSVSSDTSAWVNTCNKNDEPVLITSPAGSGWVCALWCFLQQKGHLEPLELKPQLHRGTGAGAAQLPRCSGCHHSEFCPEWDPSGALGSNTGSLAAAASAQWFASANEKTQCRHILKNILHQPHPSQTVPWS